MRQITLKGPYNFAEVLDRLSIDPLHFIDKAEKLIKVPILIDGQPIVAQVRAIGTTAEPIFQVSVTNDRTINRLTEIFHWNVQLSHIQQFFHHTELKKLFDDQYGTPLVLEFDPFSCLVKSIIHQQLNIVFAHTLSERFVKEFGFEQQGVWFYPSPETVSTLTVEQLKELQFSTRKAEYVIGTAKEIVEGRLNLADLATKSDVEVMKELVRIRGIGPWTAQSFLMFGLGRENQFPVADIGLQNALKKYFQLEKKPTKGEMELMTKEWEPYLTYASLYLWRSIEKTE